MTFSESVSTCLKKYAEFEGRAARPEYWWFSLFCVIVPTVISLASETAGAVAVFALLLPQITASTRRLHDVDKSGWLLLVGLIPLVGQLIVLYWCVLPGTAGDNEFGAPGAAA